MLYQTRSVDTPHLLFRENSCSKHKRKCAMNRNNLYSIIHLKGTCHVKDLKCAGFKIDLDTLVLIN